MKTIIVFVIIYEYFFLIGSDFMELKFSWYISNQMQDWIVSRKPYYPSLDECINWVEEKLKRDGSDYKLTKQDIDDIEIAHEFQTVDSI